MAVKTRSRKLLAKLLKGPTQFGLAAATKGVGQVGSVSAAPKLVSEVRSDYQNDRKGLVSLSAAAGAGSGDSHRAT
ncbi:MAG: hypothetical protein Q9222_003212 [Ikaeria aurantiellina]